MTAPIAWPETCICGRDFRTKDTPLTDYPNTVSRGAHGLCTSCTRRRAMGLAGPSTPRFPIDEHYMPAVIEDVEFLLDPANGHTEPAAIAQRLEYGHLEHLKLALRRAGRKDLSDRLIQRGVAA